MTIDDCGFTIAIRLETSDTQTPDASYCKRKVTFIFIKEERTVRRRFYLRGY